MDIQHNSNYPDREKDKREKDVDVMISNIYMICFFVTISMISYDKMKRSIKRNKSIIGMFTLCIYVQKLEL